MSDYPEHRKLLAGVDRIQAIGEFLKWLQGPRGVVLCTTRDDAWFPEQVPLSAATTKQLVLEFLDIDLKTLVDEEQAMREQANK